MTIPNAPQLQSIVERIERLEGEKDALMTDIKEVYTEAKSHGFDAPTIRRVIAERAKDRAKRAEQLELFDIYWNALEGGK